MNIHEKIDKLEDAVKALVELSEKTEKEEAGLFKVIKLAQIGFLRSKLLKRADKLMDEAKSGEAFK